MVAGEDVGRLGHEVHATEDDEVGVGSLLREHREPERVTACVGPTHDFVALVVVAEDEQPIAEDRFRRADALREVVGVGTGVALRQRALDAQHRWVVPPLRTLRPFGERLWLSAGGDSLVALHGDVGPRARYGAGDQAGVSPSVRSSGRSRAG